MTYNYWSKGGLLLLQLFETGAVVRGLFFVFHAGVDVRQLLQHSGVVGRELLGAVQVAQGGLVVALGYVGVGQ